MIERFEMIDVDFDNFNIDEILNKCPLDHAMIVVLTDNIMHKFIIGLN